MSFSTAWISALTLCRSARFRRTLPAQLRLPASQPTGPGLQPVQAFPDLSRSRIHYPRAARDLLARMLRQRVESVFLAHPLETGLLAPVGPQQARDLLRRLGGVGRDDRRLAPARRRLALVDPEANLAHGQLRLQQRHRPLGDAAPPALLPERRA